jgi:NADH-quinone oxidoreductase subunit N
MTTPIEDLLATAPITIASITSLIVILVGVLGKQGKTVAFWTAEIGLLAAFLAAVSGSGGNGSAFGEMVSTGGLADFGAAVFCLAGLLTILLSRSYLPGRTEDEGEYYSLILLSIVGMMLMAAARDLIILFLGLEMMSICFYVLAGFVRSDLSGNEAALKYFLLGAFATGFLLYGIALVYGTTRTTNIPGVLEAAGPLSGDPVFLIGIGLLIIGLAFKIAAVPFHMWVPDVYEGAPTTVTGFMSTGGKAAAFSAIVVVFTPALVGNVAAVREALAVIAALTMIVGNVLAVAQESIKRMLAYSSIAHAGYILTGVVAANARGSEGVLYYLLAYTVMNIGAFGVVALAEVRKGSRVSFGDLTGLAGSRPLMAGLMALFMFSLTGIPPFAGFFGKYYVFAGAVSGGYTWLAVIGVLTSLISAYYYLRLVVLMYFKDATAAPEMSRSGLAVTAIVLSALAVVGLGLYPAPIVEITSRFF